MLDFYATRNRTGKDGFAVCTEIWTGGFSTVSLSPPLRTFSERPVGSTSDTAVEQIVEFLQQGHLYIIIGCSDEEAYAVGFGSLAFQPWAERRGVSCNKHCNKSACFDRYVTCLPWEVYFSSYSIFGNFHAVLFHKRAWTHKDSFTINPSHKSDFILAKNAFNLGKCFLGFSTTESKAFAIGFWASLKLQFRREEIRQCRNPQRFWCPQSEIDSAGNNSFTSIIIAVLSQNCYRRITKHWAVGAGLQAFLTGALTERSVATGTRHRSDKNANAFKASANDSLTTPYITAMIIDAIVVIGASFDAKSSLGSGA